MSNHSVMMAFPTKIPPLLLGAIITVEMLVVLCALKFPIEVLSVVLGAGVLYWAVKNTFFGLCMIVLLHYFVIQGTEDISVMEIVFALTFVLVLGSWFFRRLFLERNRVVNDRLDFVLVSFLSLCVFSVVPAILFGASIVKWLRELIPFLNLLLIFPLREELSSIKRIKIILVCFSSVSLGVAINSILAYKQSILSAIYAWELLAMRQHANEPLFLALVIVGSGFFILSKTKTARSIALAVTMFFGFALIITFSRGFWVAALFGVFTIFLLLSASDKARMTIYCSIFAIIATGVIFLFFGDLADFFIKTITSRFQTVGGAVQDRSFANRLLEWQTVFAQIKTNPILGYGLGKTYSYNALIPIEMPTWYVHNTFLFVWYKIGLFGLITLVFFLLGMFTRGLRLYKAEENRFLKALSAGLIGCIVALVAVSFSSPQFIEKDSSLLVALVAGLIMALSCRAESSVPSPSN